MPWLWDYPTRLRNLLDRFESIHGPTARHVRRFLSPSSVAATTVVRRSRPGFARTSLEDANSLAEQVFVVRMAMEIPVQANPNSSSPAQSWQRLSAQHGRCKGQQQLARPGSSTSAAFDYLSLPQSSGRVISRVSNVRLFSFQAVGGTPEDTSGNAFHGNRGRFNAEGHFGPCRMLYRPPGSVAC
jgi:hypothetical protein